jgi:hypothetical protein
MTPREKAEELFDKMLYNDGNSYHHCSHYVGKNCALIAVGEIVKVIGYDPLTLGQAEIYWEEVKQEIEKL